MTSLHLLEVQKYQFIFDELFLCRRALGAASGFRPTHCEHCCGRQNCCCRFAPATIRVTLLCYPRETATVNDRKNRVHETLDGVWLCDEGLSRECRIRQRLPIVVGERRSCNVAQ